VFDLKEAEILIGTTQNDLSSNQAKSTNE
jgi:hypothetical protein